MLLAEALDIVQLERSRIPVPVILILFVALCQLLCPGSARASETALPITPTGGTDLHQASLPPPGLYGAVAVLPFNQNDQASDHFGNRLPDAASVKFSIPAAAIGLSYVYPFKVFGGSVASSIQLPYYRMSYRIGSAPEVHHYSIADTYSDIFLWSRRLASSGRPSVPQIPPPGLDLAIGLALTAPTGAYSKANPINVGSHVWLFTPNAALTYSFRSLRGDGNYAEVSVRAFYGFPTRNPATHYQSGQALTLNFSASQRVSKVVTGLAGSIIDQTTSDVLPSGERPPFGNKYFGLSLGPVVEYDIKPGLIAIAKYSRAVVWKNGLNTQFLSAALVFKM